MIFEIMTILDETNSRHDAVEKKTTELEDEQKDS